MQEGELVQSSGLISGKVQKFKLAETANKEYLG